MGGREFRIQNAGVRIHKLSRELILKDSYWGKQLSINNYQWTMLIPKQLLLNC